MALTDVRLIDANALKNEMADDLAATIRMSEMHKTDMAVRVLNKIDEANTIDAVPVVRCRNCRLWRRTDKHYGKCPFLIGEHQYTSEDGFCNLGEKMDGGAEG
jgi:rubrerythrin